MQHSRLNIRLLSAILLVSVSALAWPGTLVGAAHAAGKSPPKKIEQSARQQQSWKKGGKYAGKGAAVADYRRYHLKAPPKGHRWVRDGNQFLLVTTATGIIAAISGN